MKIKKKLEQYGSLIEEQKETDKKINKLQTEIEELERIGKVIDTVSGGNGGIQHFKVEGVPVPAYTKKINSLQISLLIRQQLSCKIDEQRNEIEKFICTVNDSMIRRMLEYKYISNMTWNEVAKKMGKTYTADYCRITSDRFLKNYDNKCSDCSPK